MQENALQHQREERALHQRKVRTFFLLNGSVSCAGRQRGVAAPTFALSSVSLVENDGPNSTGDAKSYGLPVFWAGAETVSRR